MNTRKKYQEKEKRRTPEKKAPPVQVSGPIKAGEHVSDKSIGKRAFRRGVFSRVYTAGAIVVVTAALVWAFTAFFTVSEIQVYGNSHYTVDDIVKLSGIRYGESLVLLNRAKVRGNIMGDNPYIEDVSVKKLFPGTVELTVTDKTVATAFETNGAYWLVSGAGNLLNLSLQCPENVTVIKGAKLVDSAAGKPFQCEDEVRQIIIENLLRALRENSLNDKVEEIDISKTYAVVLQVVMSYEDSAGVFDIVLGNAETIAQDCSRIEAVVTQAQQQGKTSGTFDMRDGSIRYTESRWDFGRENETTEESDDRWVPNIIG